MKLYIIANRLPVRAISEQDNFTFVRSEGGLATGLDSLEVEKEKHWIGWPGLCVEDMSAKEKIRHQLSSMNCHPVFLTEKQYKEYYEGYSNSTLWPLCHYFFSYTLVKKNFWETYKEVNQLFCDEICKQVEADDWVWIQDYQLMLLPYLLRERMPKLHIGYFHHIPFPSYELFRILPERAELLKGLLGADFIAFHTHDYVRHFISAAERVMHLNFNLNEVQLDSRTIRVDALPMGINYDLYHRAAENEKVWQAIEKNQKLFGDHKLILSVDRLDYSKGILHRLQGFQKFLEQYPEYRNKVTLVMIIVPSRDHVGSYADLKTRIDEVIGSINGRYSTMDWTPVTYFYHSFSFEKLAAMYYVADVALVTPLRDGMNLVAKEYVATKTTNSGVLILSEMAGAAVEMTGAIQINPNDAEQIAVAIYQALTMPKSEQKQRIQKMQTTISTETVNKWATDFMDEWQEVIDKNTYLLSKRLSLYKITQIKDLYNQTSKRLIVLDYDGTLVGFTNSPEDAAPSPEVLDVLQKLCNDPANRVVINSGRDQQTLEKWLGHLPLDLAAEHGACFKENGIWKKKTSTIQWSEGILSILRMFVEKTPHSHIEMKETSLIWHYREVEPCLGELRAQQLVRSLISICQQQHLQVLQGNKIVEINSPEYTKGTEIRLLLQKTNYDFVLAIGDDTTDDDMFCSLSSKAITIKVGKFSEYARYNLAEQKETLPFLKSMIGTGYPHRDIIHLDEKEEKKGIVQLLKKLFNRHPNRSVLS